MHVTMHFSTFLKLLTSSTGDKIRDLARYAQPGGFDFYRPSREGVTKFLVDNLTEQDAVDFVKKVASTNGVERNVEILDNAVVWLKKQKGAALRPGKSVWKSPNRVFSIVVEPEICLKSADGLKIVAVYPRKDVRLNRDQAGAAIELLRIGYPTGESAKFGIYDAFGEKAFWTPTNASSSILNHEIRLIEEELSSAAAA